MAVGLNVRLTDTDENGSMVITSGVIENTPCSSFMTEWSSVAIWPTLRMCKLIW